MKNYQHILVGVDYSEHNHTVLAKAQALAGLYGAKLSIVHIVDNIPMPDTNYGTIIPLDVDSGYDLLETEKNKLRRLGQQLAITPDNQWLIWGIPKQEICQLAERQAIDLIIVGSHFQQGLALLFGSTADGVLHHSYCDVLAVRINDE